MLERVTGLHVYPKGHWSEEWSLSENSKSLVRTTFFAKLRTSTTAAAVLCY